MRQQGRDGDRGGGGGGGGGTVVVENEDNDKGAPHGRGR